MKNAKGLGKVNDCIEAERKTKNIRHRLGSQTATRGGVFPCSAAGSAAGVPQ